MPATQHRSSFDSISYGSGIRHHFCRTSYGKRPLLKGNVHRATMVHVSAFGCRAKRTLIKNQAFPYRNQIAMPPNATGHDQAQSPNKGMAAAATTQPTRKPKRRRRDLLNRPASAAINGRPCGNISISERTVLVRLPVITAVEIPPGKAKRKRANWQAIAETAIMTAMPAIKPWGLVEGFVITLKIKIPARSRN